MGSWVRRGLLTVVVVVACAHPASAAFASVGTIGTSVTAAGDSLVFTVDAGGAASGNLVCLGTATNSATIPVGVSDSKSNTWAKLGEVTRTGLSVSLYCSTLTSALVAADTISVDYAGSQTGSAGGWEWSGITGQPTVDVSNTGNNGTAIDVPPTASITTTVANDLVVAITAISSAASTTLDHNPPTNYTAGPLKTDGSPEFYMVYSIISGTATRAWDSNQWNKTGNVGTVNVGIKLTSSASPPMRSLLGVGQ